MEADQPYNVHSKTRLDWHSLHQSHFPEWSSLAKQAFFHLHMIFAMLIRLVLDGAGGDTGVEDVGDGGTLGANCTRLTGL